MNEKTKPITLTVRQVMAWEPCKRWPRERVLKYFGDRTEVQLLDILHDESIDIHDRIWIGCKALPEFRWWCADRARLHAASALERAGLHDNAQALRDLDPVVDKTTAQAMKVVAEAAARAARAAAEAAEAAWAAAEAAEAAEAAGYTRLAERQAQLERLIEMATVDTQS